MKGIHENILDFEILETGNIKTIVFVDSSQYMENPEKPILEIILPGTNKYVLVNISPRNVNTFTSNSLNLTPTLLNNNSLIDLPDGVYVFKYKICPYQYVNRVKTHLRVTNLVNDLNVLLDYLNPDIDDDYDDLKQEIVDIFVLIESAKASAILGNTNRASNKYQLADRAVRKITDRLEAENKKYREHGLLSVRKNHRV